MMFGSLKSLIGRERLINNPWNSKHHMKSRYRSLCRAVRCVGRPDFQWLVHTQIQYVTNTSSEADRLSSEPQTQQLSNDLTNYSLAGYLHRQFHVDSNHEDRHRRPIIRLEHSSSTYKWRVIWKQSHSRIKWVSSYVRASSGISDGFASGRAPVVIAYPQPIITVLWVFDVEVTLPRWHARYIEVQVTTASSLVQLWVRSTDKARVSAAERTIRLKQITKPIHRMRSGPMPLLSIASQYQDRF